MKTKLAIWLLLPWLVTGCASYRPLQLPGKANWANSVAHLKVDDSGLSRHALDTHRFDPADGLDMTEVAMLAVANNPGLRLARDDARLANAQAFAAGLLPDPQLAYSRDFPKPATPGAMSGYSAGLGYQWSSLVSHAAYTRASADVQRQTDLNVLWQEWQVIAQARLLFSRAVAQHQLLAWLVKNRDFLATRFARNQAALAEGNYTRNGVNTALIAWQASSRQVNDLRRQALQTRIALNSLLGLQPDVKLHLRTQLNVQLPDRKHIDQMLQALPQRRPDLLALKAGYAASDQRYRQAILAQFPAFSLAFTAARDTAGLLTQGYALSLSLPLFNHNRGNVAIREASCQRLHDEYQFRLNTAHAEVRRLLADSRLITAQLRTAEAGMHLMDETADSAEEALDEGLIDGLGNAQFQSARIAKHVEVTNLRQALREDKIALLTLLGSDMRTEKGER